MLKVGLTGGYASGKSFVANRLADLGCHFINADQLGRQVMSPDGAAYAPLLTWFSTACPNMTLVNTDYTIDRKKLAAFVFNDPAALQQLNAIVHPAVFEVEAQALADFQTRDPAGIAVIEAAILIETGRYRVFDRLIVTSCPPELQIERAMARDQVTRTEAEHRLARQLTGEERLRFAHFVVDTAGAMENTLKQIDEIYVKLKQLAEAPPL